MDASTQTDPAHDPVEELSNQIRDLRAQLERI